MFDTFLVVFTLVDELLLFLQVTSLNASLVRLFRMFRLVRILRLLRMVRMLNDLRISVVLAHPFIVLYRVNGGTLNDN